MDHMGDTFFLYHGDLGGSRTTRALPVFRVLVYFDITTSNSGLAASNMDALTPPPQMYELLQSIFFLLPWHEPTTAYRVVNQVYQNKSKIRSLVGLQKKNSETFSMLILAASSRSKWKSDVEINGQAGEGTQSFEDAALKLQPLLSVAFLSEVSMHGITCCVSRVSRFSKQIDTFTTRFTVLWILFFWKKCTYHLGVCLHAYQMEEHHLDPALYIHMAFYGGHSCNHCNEQRHEAEYSENAPLKCPSWKFLLSACSPANFSIFWPCHLSRILAII